MRRVYVGQVTINGQPHKLTGENRDAVAWAVGALADTAARLGWEIRDTAVMTQLRSSITGRAVGEGAM